MLPVDDQMIRPLNPSCHQLTPDPPDEQYERVTTPSRWPLTPGSWLMFSRPSLALHLPKRPV